jgi:hypothetical protein
MKADKMGGSCSTHERDEKYVQCMARKSEVNKGTIWKDSARMDV